jgi:CO/xanthine dehydrogenase FAD-binding subunit
MELWQNYYKPRSVAEALGLLAQYSGEARVIAGGTDLLIDMQHGGGEHAPVAALIDVTTIDEMTRIERQDDLLLVGAAVTHNTIVKSALLEQGATCLVESCGVVGGPQVRNVGTLGGNVAHALPAGDGTTSLMALDAEAEVAWGDGRRDWQPLRQLFKGPGVSTVNPHQDLLVGFRFPAPPPHSGSAFKRVMRPQGVALPVLGCAVWVRLSDSGDTYEEVQICISPVGPVPTRAAELEAVIIGAPANQETLDAAVHAAYVHIHPRASKYRATAEYRSLMIESLLRHALPKATERARSGSARAENIGMG